MSDGLPRTSPWSLLWVVVLVTSMGLLLPAIVLGGVVIGWIEPSLTAHEQQVELQSKLELLSLSVSEVLWNLERSGVSNVVSAVMASPNVVSVQVVDSATATDFYRDFRPERAIGHQYQGERDVMRNGIKIGRVRIEIDDQLAADSQIQHRLLYMVTALAQLLVAVLFVVVLLHRWVIRPLRSLGGFANTIASGNFSTPVASAKIQEINQLTDHMLHMQAALQAQFAANDLHKKRLLQTAHFDALTGLPNRVLLADRLPKALAQSARRTLPLALLFLDLDGFKWVNDNYGHEVGDLLLKGVSQHLQATLREGDMLARFGGDEFVAILMDLHHPRDVIPLLERLLHAAAEPITVGEHVLRVSVSIGVALFDPQDPSDIESLYRKADQAMYYAKQAGKNRFHCASPLT